VPAAKLVEATRADVPALVELHARVAARLTERYGRGHWSHVPTERGVLYNLRLSPIYVVRRRGGIAATLRLTSRKPWAIDVRPFTPCARPLYLVDMAVDPDRQGKGVGRSCLEAVPAIARAWPADAIRLDAYDAPAGAGGFYARCGYREVGRATYRGVSLIYFEQLVPAVLAAAPAVAAGRGRPR
jgi:GNAT superfamily N-acetyltransferase